MALKLMILFPITFENKTAFSTLVTITSKSQNRKDVTHDVKVTLVAKKTA